MQDINYSFMIMRTGIKMAPYIYKTYCDKPYEISEKKWKEVLVEVCQTHDTIPPEIVIGAFFYTLKKLQDPTLYPSPIPEDFSIKKLIKDLFYEDFRNGNSLKSNKDIFKKTFYKLAHELSCKLLITSMLEGYLSNIYELYPKRDVVEWLVKAGCADREDTAENRSRCYDLLPYPSKIFLEKEIRKELKVTTPTRLHPILILTRRWNFETLLKVSDNLYFDDLVYRLIQSDKDYKEKLVKGCIDTSLKHFVLTCFKEIDTGENTLTYANQTINLQDHEPFLLQAIE